MLLLLPVLSRSNSRIFQPCFFLHAISFWMCLVFAALPETFGDYWDGWDSFGQYVEHMRKAGSWGNHLTLMAAAHVLMRPIHVLTDSVHDVTGAHTISQPTMILSEFWGQPIMILHFGELHYDATEKIVKPDPEQ